MKRFSCQKENVVSIKHHEHKTQHYLSESITLSFMLSIMNTKHITLPRQNHNIMSLM